MNYEEAKKIIQDDKASFIDYALAGAEISASKESTFEDLLLCLQRGGQAASPAACALYIRTKRPRSDDTVQSFSMDYNDWLNFLRSKNLVT